MKKELSFMFRAIWAAYSFIVGRIVAALIYDKKYLENRYFKGRALGINAIGWKWTLCDLKGRMEGKNNHVPWPVSRYNTILHPERIHFDPEDLINFQGVGKYYQAVDGDIYVGKGTLIANNVGMITANHKLGNITEHSSGRDIRIGKCCWIAMNAVILPGVTLGDNTVVGAGAVVTKSFAAGNCVLAGIPAQIIKSIDAGD